MMTLVHFGEAGAIFCDGILLDYYIFSFLTFTR